MSYDKQCLHSLLYIYYNTTMLSNKAYHIKGLNDMTIKETYLAQIKKLQANIAKREALLLSGEFTDLNKYPEYMQRELTAIYIDADKDAISQLTQLIAELN